MLLPVRFDKSDWLRITKGFSVYAQNFGSRQRSRFLALIKRNAVFAFRDDLRKKSSQCSRHYDILTSDMRMRKRSLSSLVCFRARGSCYLAPRNRDSGRNRKRASITAVNCSTHVPEMISVQFHSHPQCCSF